MARKLINEYEKTDSLEDIVLLGYKEGASPSTATRGVPASLFGDVLGDKIAYYFNSLPDASNALRYDDFSTASYSQDEESKIKVTLTPNQTILDMLDDIVISTSVGIYNSIIFNTNGYNIELQNDARLGFVENSETGVVEVTMNCKGTTIFRSGSQTTSGMAIQVTCSKFTINDCHIVDYNSSDFVNGTPAGNCIGIGINKTNNISTINKCDIRCSGRYRAMSVYMSTGKLLTLNECTCYGGALFDHADVYDIGQSAGMAVYVSRDVEEVNVYGGTYSGEFMAAQFGATKTTLVGATFESCDHGVYFTGENSSARLCNFNHYRWPNLLCSTLIYPFKEGEPKTKSQYTAQNPDYANSGTMYIGSPYCDAKVAIFNCTEDDDINSARISLSSNYGYRNTYCFLSGFSIKNKIRVDGMNEDGFQSHLIVGRDVTPTTLVLHNPDNSGYINTTDFALNQFYSTDNIAALVEVIKLKETMGD